MKKTLFNLVFCIPIFLYGRASSVSVNSAGNISQYDLVISEIMADPDPPNGLPASEYCEIYNRGSNPVNLSGWVFFDGSIRQLPSIQIDPGEYIIVCDDDDTSLFSVYGKCAAVSSISLTNSGEKISLRDPFGFPVDSVIYSDSWFGSSFKKDGGWSIEKVDIDFTCPVSSNWKPSENNTGGTPGIINSVAGIIVDEVPPLLLRSFCSDSVSVTIVFNEPLDPMNAISIQNFNFNSSFIPVSADFSDASLQRITLTFYPPITPGIKGAISVDNITDCLGNPVSSENTIYFGLADTSSFRSIVINEILFNPPEGGNDFIELYHNGTGIIDLSELRLVSLNALTELISQSITITEEPWLIFPGEFMVLTENVEAVASQFRTSFPYHFIELNEFPTMNADEGFVGISIHDEILDSFHYFEEYHFALLEETKGISLEKINPELESSDASAWHSAAQTAGFATPGLKNSQFSEWDHGTSEVVVSPEIFSPDNDGMDDVLTITLKIGTPGYISNLWIYNTDGQVVFDHAKNSHLSTSNAFIWDGITYNGIRAAVGIYVAVVELFNLEGAIKKYRLPFVVASKL